MVCIDPAVILGCIVFTLSIYITLSTDLNRSRGIKTQPARFFATSTLMRFQPTSVAFDVPPKFRLVLDASRPDLLILNLENTQMYVEDASKINANDQGYGRRIKAGDAIR